MKPTFLTPQGQAWHRPTPELLEVIVDLALLEVFFGLGTVGGYRRLGTVGGYCGLGIVGGYCGPGTVGGYCGLGTVGGYCGLGMVGRHYETHLRDGEMALWRYPTNDQGHFAAHLSKCYSR